MFIIINEFIYHNIIFVCEENSLKIEYKSSRKFCIPHSFNREGLEM